MYNSSGGPCTGAIIGPLCPLPLEWDAYFLENRLIGLGFGDTVTGWEYDVGKQVRGWATVRLDVAQISIVSIVVFVANHLRHILIHVLHNHVVTTFVALRVVRAEASFPSLNALLDVVVVPEPQQMTNP